MTWTYTNNPGYSTAAERRDAVRLLIRDTVQSAAVTLTDEEIAFFLRPFPALNAVAVYLAASDACESMAGGWNTQADSVSIGETKVEYRSKAKDYADLGRRLKAQARQGINGFSVLGSSVSANATLAADTDVVQPQAYVGQDAAPGTVPQLGTVEQVGQ
jgi:hypothetical protein